ncbi:MAG: AAA family ATPase [Hyphomicrobiales bacterium]
MSSADFVSGFRPPDYLLDGILQRGFLYSLTGATGGGKTAIALLLAARAAQNQFLAGRDCTGGRVIYFAGENAEDVRMRWVAMAEMYGFDPSTIDVHFVEGTFSLTTFADCVGLQIEELGGAALVIVDTSPAYFEGQDENSNVELGNHARMLRKLTGYRGNPCVLALCHPTKGTTSENLLPRGGGAFLAEVDGNLTARLTDMTVELHWQGKLRGPGFEPLSFELKSTTAQRLRDSRGRQITTVVARDLTPAEADARVAASLRLQDQVLVAMNCSEKLSIAEIARKIGLIGSTGDPQKSKVHHLLGELEEAKLVTKIRKGQYILTDKGEREALKKAILQRSERTDAPSSNLS